MAAVVITGLSSAALLWKCADWLEVSGRARLIFILVMIIVHLLSAVEALQLIIPFRRRHQRATYGTAQWGEISYLRDLHLARAKERATGQARLEDGELRLGNLRPKHELVLPAEQVLCHTAIFGPPGAGKSPLSSCICCAIGRHQARRSYSIQRASCMSRRPIATGTSTVSICRTRRSVTAGTSCLRARAVRRFEQANGKRSNF